MKITPGVFLEALVSIFFTDFLILRYHAALSSMVKIAVSRVEIAAIPMGVKIRAGPPMVIPGTKTLANQINAPLINKAAIPTVNTINGSKIRDKIGHNIEFKIPTTAAATKAVSQASIVKPTEISAINKNPNDEPIHKIKVLHSQ
jgi:hypothetical protein